MSADSPETYLELANRMAQEAGVDGDPAFTTVLGATGELKRVRDWVNDAYREIVGTQHWSFLWENPTITMQLGLNVIASGVLANRWDKDCTWIIPPASNADRQLDYIPWKDFSIIYRTLNSPGQITAWTVRPDGAFVTNAVSTEATGTTINVQRYKTFAPLVTDDDQPLIPSDLRMLIVWTGLKKYAGYDEAGNQRTIAVDEMKTLRNALNARCLPEMQMGGSLLDIYD